MFMPIIISPTDNPNFLDITSDMISVPSSEPSFLSTIPTPVPRIIPPKTVARSKSFVIVIE